MQLFSGLEANTVDHYEIKAWSQAHGQEVVFASLELDEHGVLYVSPTEAGAPHYASLGLVENGKGSYLIDLLEAPKTLVAKTLGLPHGALALDQLLSKPGEPATGYHVLEAALQGLPEQSGRIVAGGEVGSRFVKIDENQFLSPGARKLPGFSSLYVRGQDEFDGMVKTDVLIKNGSEIIPAYIVSVQAGSHENAADRLAIYAATLQEAGKLKHVVADKPLQFAATAEGQPALVCQDMNRPVFGIVAIGQSRRNPGITMVSLEHSLLNAKTFVEPVGALQLEKTQDVIRSLAKANALREFALDSPGVHPHAPGKVEGTVHLGRLTIPRHATVESLAATAQAESHRLSGPVAALAKRISLNAAEVESEANQLFKAVSRNAASLVAEVEWAVDAASTPQDRERPKRSQDAYEL